MSPFQWTFADCPILNYTSSTLIFLSSAFIIVYYKIYILYFLSSSMIVWISWGEEFCFFLTILSLVPRTAWQIVDIQQINAD